MINNTDKIVIDGIPEKAKDSTRIMSFNLRYCDDKEGSVKDRSVISTAIIEQYEPDSVGVQEATGEWMAILSDALRGYACVGESREEDPDSEYSAVFYLKDKFTLLDSGTIWLSDTPYVKYTKYEESVCTRIATWAALENKQTGVRYAHINTHLDHISDNSRALQTDVLKAKIAELEKAGFSVVCTGDFNAEPSGEAYRRMLTATKDSRTVAAVSEDGVTYHGYGRLEDNSAGPIDYAFVSQGVEVDRYKIIRNTVGNMYPSDHYPIMVDVCFLG